MTSACRNDLNATSRPTKPKLSPKWVGPESRTGRYGTLPWLAEEQFDVFLTVDQNLTFQQNLTGLALCIVTLWAKSNDIDDLRPLMPRVLERLPAALPGEVIRIG